MKKTNKISINEKRKQLETFYKQNEFKRMKTLEKISIKSSQNPSSTFDNLIRIVADKDILFQAMGNISKKSGALTPGTELYPRTVDASSEKLINELSENIKNGKFHFKPIRRVYMDKSGKNPVTKEQKEELIKLHRKGKVTMQQIKELKTRPLGISSFPEKIVQEAIRMVLNAIYEPLFAKTNTNFGFRPGLGCQDAINQIKTYAKSMDYAIEGDIKGAFDNVNHDILIQLLNKKITDQKFLKLIRSGLKSGTIYLSFRQDSDLGTTQGSVVSPLLYNIYFHEFDTFITTTFKEIVESINKKENRTPKPINKLYNSFSKQKTKLKLKIKYEQVKQLQKYYKNNQDQLKEKFQELEKTKKDYKILDNEQKKLRSYAKSRQTIRFWYTRYADDWVFLTNADYTRVKEWKELFKNFIKDELKLTLSDEKTKITKLNKGEAIKFLGYQIIRQVKQRIVKSGIFKVTKTSLTNKSKQEKQKVIDKSIFKIRGTNPTLIVAWDRTRVLDRLISNHFVKKIGNTWRGTSKLPWTTLPEPEILDRYNYMIRGYLNYYTPVIQYPNDMLFLFYLLKFSCAHTLAQKRRTTLKNIFSKFGKDIKISYKKFIKEKDQTTNTIQEKEIFEVKPLLTWQDCERINEQIIIRTLKKHKENKSISEINKAVDEICNVKINWRTKYKLSQHCAVCGSQENIEYHHVKHIKIGKTEGFLQVMKQLNRKQIPVCKQCHLNIHNGKYNDLALKDLYDEELIII